MSTLIDTKKFIKEIHNLKKEKNKKKKEQIFLTCKQLGSKIIENYIVNKKKFLIINLNTKNKKKLIDLSELISKILGLKVSQNKKGDKTVFVTPDVDAIKKNNYKIDTSIRYHQSNIGGSIHTDGPQLNSTPNIVIMCCLANSAKGGVSILVDGEKIYNYIKKKNPKIIKTLSKKFYFERRGFKKNLNYIFKAPIFKKNKKSLEFRYLREYIINAYKIKDKKISKEKLKSLDFLDKCLGIKNMQSKYKLSEGEIIIINNKLMAHGRTSFNLNKLEQRKIMRIWLK